MRKVLKNFWLRAANHTRKYMYKDNSYNYTLFDIIITLGAFWISIFALDKVSNTPYLDCTSNLLNMCNYVVRKISFPLSHHVIIVFINIQKCILGYTIITCIWYVWGCEWCESCIKILTRTKHFTFGNNEWHNMVVVGVVIVMHKTSSFVTT